jgi:tRNA(Ile)-lysidine synthase
MDGKFKHIPDAWNPAIPANPNVVPVVPLTPEYITTILGPLNCQKHVFIAYSGGLDSHVLLHLCASLETLRDKITAVYVHHGLQDDADFWHGHCVDSAAHLGVKFLGLRINAAAKAGESPEAAARDARYAALSDLLNEGDLLLTGQHREDQLETVLLQLFRGAGVQGLSGMPLQMPCGKGTLVRPLLLISQQALRDYAQQHALSWVEDQSNLDDGYERNFLRNQVIPLLKMHWPSIDKTVSRSASLCAETQAMVADTVDELFQQVFVQDDQTILINRLREVDLFSRQLLIRRWFQALDLRMPSVSVVARILTEVVGARADREPKLQLQGYLVRRYRDKLYLLQETEVIDTGEQFVWAKQESVLALPGNGYLQVIESTSGIDVDLWHSGHITVAYRQGGESLLLPGRKGSHSLKKLFQEAGIPPWERTNIPLIFIDGHLAAVAGMYSGEEFCRQQDGRGVKILWSKPESMILKK